MAADVLSRHHRMRAVSPASPDHIAELEVGDAFAECIDFADLGVTPDINGIVKRGLPGQEERRLGIPLLLQIRVRASIYRQLGPSRDAGIERTNPNLRNARLGCRILAYPDHPRGSQLDDIGHQTALWEIAVVRRASSEIRELSKPKTADRIRSSRGSMKWRGSWSAPSTVPTTEPAVAPFESVSQPPCTVKPTVAVKSPSPQRSPAVIKQPLLMACTQL